MFKDKIKKFIQTMYETQTKEIINYIDKELKRYRIACNVGNNRILTTTIYKNKIFIPACDLSLTPCILIDGYWEKWITDYFITIIKSGDTILDIGCNVGYYTLLCRNYVGDTGKVVAFDANPELVSMVNDTLAINGYQNNCICYNYAVCSENGEKTFCIQDKYLGGSHLLNKPHKNRIEHELVVKSIKLDDFINEKVDIIKIDVEGSEFDVLKGAEKILYNNKNIKIITEFSVKRFINSEDSLDDFFLYLNKLGFNAFEIKYDSTLKKIEKDSIPQYLCDIVLQRL